MTARNVLSFIVDLVTVRMLVRGRGGGGRGSVAHPNTGAHLAGVQVIVHQAVDDVGQLGLDHGFTENLQGGVDGSQSGAELEIFQQLMLSSH